MPRPRVCILHVGGTIGMVRGPQGYVPEVGFVERTLETMEELSRAEVPAWDLFRLDPLLDSANMTPRDWVRVAREITQRSEAYDGFVVLHGTDTLVYTASALSFLLRGVNKPIVLTGAQLSLDDVRSDGRQHIITSLLLAGSLDVPEVCVYFSGLLLRGNRAQKVDNQNFIAFASPNYPPLARVGVAVDLEESLLRARTPDHPSVTQLRREPQVAALRVFPGLSAELLHAVFAQPVEGLVLETYGAGTFPTANQALLDAIALAVESGVVVVNCTQCQHGRVRQDLYGTSAPLAEIGVVSGHDMTPEAGLTKLYCLLASGASPAEVRRQMEVDLAGELTLPRAGPPGRSPR